MPLRDPSALRKGDRIWVRKVVDGARYGTPKPFERLFPAVVRGAGPRVVVVQYPDPDLRPPLGPGARGEVLPWEPQPGLFEAPFLARTACDSVPPTSQPDEVPRSIVVPEHNERALGRRVCFTEPGRLQDAGGTALAPEGFLSVPLPSGLLPRSVRARRWRVYLPEGLRPERRRRAIRLLMSARDAEWLEGDAARVYLPRDRFLALVWALAETFSYRSRRRARVSDVPPWLLDALVMAEGLGMHEIATADLAGLCALPDAPTSPRLREAAAAWPRYVDHVDGALEWIRRVPTRSNDFLEGLRHALETANLPTDRVAWAASLYAASKRSRRSSR